MGSAIETRFQMNMKANDAFGTIFQTLKSMGKNNLRIVREIPPFESGNPRNLSYVLLEYCCGFMGLQARQIELNFNERESSTVVLLKWHYPNLESQRRDSNFVVRNIASGKARELEQTVTLLIEDLKSRIGATEVSVNAQANVREIIREKQVIIKIRCQYCKSLFDESIDKCPNCGGKR